MVKEIIVLAKGNKCGAYCVAGIDVDSGKWIRPVSAGESHDGYVPIQDTIYQDGKEVEILDKVLISLIEHRPTKSQPENYLYDNNYYWVKTGRSTIEQVIKFRGFDETNYIFCNVYKELSESELCNTGSLLTVRVENPKIFIKTFEQRKIQLNFAYNRNNYSYLKISDPKIKREYRQHSDGSYHLGNDLIIVFSLTGKYKKRVNITKW